MTSSSPSTTATTPPSNKRTIKRKLDESILKKARIALGLPLESHDADEDKNEQQSLKWRKPRHNTAEGQAYIKSKEKRQKMEEQSGVHVASAKGEGKQDKKKGKKKRKKKAKNHQQTLPVVASKDPEGEKRHGMEAISYLQLWASNRDHWKFEKRKQTWLLKNCLNSNLIDDTRFDTLLEYIGTVKGAARQTTLNEMQSLVTKYEMTAESANTSKEDLESSGDNNSKITTTENMYERARQIIQVLTDD